MIRDERNEGRNREICLWRARRFFAGSTAERTLDFESYDPRAFTDEDFKDFREGFAIIDTPVADEFTRILEAYEISPADLRKAAEEGDPWPLEILVNFDEMLFVDETRDVVAKWHHVPWGWTATEDESLKYLPDGVREIWKRSLS